MSSPSGSWCFNCGHTGRYHGQKTCNAAAQTHPCDCTAYVDAGMYEAQRVRVHEETMARIEVERIKAENGAALTPESTSCVVIPGRGCIEHDHKSSVGGTQ